MNKAYFLVAMLFFLLSLSTCDRRLDSPDPRGDADLSALEVEVTGLSAGDAQRVARWLGQPELQRYLQLHGLRPGAPERVVTPSGEVFFGLPCQAMPPTTGPAADHYLAWYPDGSAPYRQILFRRQGGSGEPAARSLRPGEANSPRTVYGRTAELDYLTLVDPVQDKVVYETRIGSADAKKICRQGTRTFEQCMDCATGKLTGDWLTLSACAVSGWWPCLAAAVIHCY